VSFQAASIPLQQGFVGGGQPAQTVLVAILPRPIAALTKDLLRGSTSSSKHLLRKSFRSANPPEKGVSVSSNSCIQGSKGAFSKVLASSSSGKAEQQHLQHRGRL